MATTTPTTTPTTTAAATADSTASLWLFLLPLLKLLRIYTSMSNITATKSTIVNFLLIATMRLFTFT